MNKKKLAIYPFNDECNVFTDFLDLLSEKYIFCEAAAPRSWYYSSKKINTSYGEYIVKYSIRDFEQKCDVLLIPDFGELYIAEGSVAKEICKYVDKFSEIVSDAFFSTESIEMIEKKCKENGCIFKNLRNTENIIQKREVSQFLSKIDTPIIAVTGMWDNTNKFYAQLQLKRKLEQNGYKVTMIGSRGYSEFFDAYRFPEFMFSLSQPDIIKPVIFSEYVHKLENAEEPDVFIIGVPEPVHSLSDKISHGFGIIPYMVFQSINPDFLIYCSLFFEKPEIADEEKMICRYRLGVSPDIIHISNSSIVLDTDASSNGYIQEKIEMEKVHKLVNDLNESRQIMAMDITDDAFADTLMTAIENKLCHEEWSVV